MNQGIHRLGHPPFVHLSAAASRTLNPLPIDLQPESATSSPLGCPAPRPRGLMPPPGAPLACGSAAILAVHGVGAVEPHPPRGGARLEREDVAGRGGAATSSWVILLHHVLDLTTAHLAWARPPISRIHNIHGRRQLDLRTRPGGHPALLDVETTERCSIGDEHTRADGLMGLAER